MHLTVSVHPSRSGESLSIVHLSILVALDLHERFIDFLKTSQQYRPSQLVRHLPEGAMPEARAILLGRMDQHEKALQIYVYQMHEYRLAEE